MTAREIISPMKVISTSHQLRSVDASLPVMEVLPRLLDTPTHELEVNDGEVSLGIIDQTSMLEGLGRLIAARDDCSVITIECSPENYSASVLAHAVEDSDAHLVDLLSSPTPEGMIRVTLRVRNTNPTSTIHNLERYDFQIVESHGADSENDGEVALERLLSLRALLNV